MSAASAKLDSLYQGYLQLGEEERKAFLTAIGDSTRLADKRSARAHAKPPERREQTLYNSIKQRLYEYRGITLPELVSLSSTSAEAELHAALEWMTRGERIDAATLSGLCDIAADAVAREIPWQRGQDDPWSAQFCNRRKRNALLVEQIKRIAEAVDRGYPGYRHNGILLSIARAAGQGKLHKLQTTR